ncbi:MAG: T9SS type A sorting domain-containing protein [Chitinophagales bacterium]|nr:T9SS type A sorting domain-containing protein [Chitinophagales bacterium]
MVLSSDSNCGHGHLAAWINYDNGMSTYQLKWKLNWQQSMYFKPGKPNSVVQIKDDGFSAYPNPAASEVNVSGLRGNASYMAADITGKTVMQGEVSPSSNSIDISRLQQGVYIFSFNEAGTITQLKLVKE